MYTITVWNGITPPPIYSCPCCKHDNTSADKEVDCETRILCR